MGLPFLENTAFVRPELAEEVGFRSGLTIALGQVSLNQLGGRNEMCLLEQVDLSVFSDYDKGCLYFVILEIILKLKLIKLHF